MTSKKLIYFKSSEIDGDMTLAEIPSSDLRVVLRKLCDLQSTLNSMSMLQNSKLGNATTRTRSTLIAISLKIVRIIARRSMQRSNEALQVWENEGGKVQ